MNKSYRLIWSKAKDAWVIAAEIVKGSGGPAPLTRALLAVASVMALSTGALALPTGPQIINGSVSMSSQGSTLTITNSPNSIINWQGFSIAASETTRFVQQNSASAVLNRVVGVDPSSIMGTLQSNGRIFLLNPNGIIFGQGSRVDAAGLVASTLHMSDSDFLGGKYIFNASPSAGAVKNQGEISTPSGGHVWLIAPDVENSGIITAPNGSVTLAAGQSVHVVDPDKPEVAVVVSAPSDQAVNLGSVVAQGGRIAMYGAIVGQKGNVNANSAVRGQNGRIYFKSTRSTTLAAGSTTSASGPDGGTITVQAENGDTLIYGDISATGTEGKGGTVQLLGQRVGLLDTATVDASGTSGGGTVLVGGDYQGKNPDIQNAQATYVGKEATIKADATLNGDGGKVIVWADDVTRVYGSISARGGAEGGNGGFVETSGKNYLDYQGRTDTRAPKGTVGTLLLDPADIVIGSTTTDLAGTSPGTGFWTFDNGTGAPSQLLASDLVFQLGLANVTVNTTPGSGGTGKIDVNNAINWSGATSLTLQANDVISVNANITNGSTGAINLTSSGAGINVSPGITIANSGTLQINSAGSFTSGAGSSINGSAVMINTTAGGNITVGGTVLASGTLALNTIGSFNIETPAGGLLQSDVIILQNSAGATGNIGSPTYPVLNTSSGTGTTLFSIGGSAAGTPSSVNISHNGNATFNPVYLGTNTPFSFISTLNLAAPAIATGSSDLTLKSTSGSLTTTGALSGANINLTAGAGDFSPAGNISATNNLMIDLLGSGAKFTRMASTTVGGTATTQIKADKIDNSGTGSLGAVGSLVTLLPKTGGRLITLGTDTTDAGSDLELSTNDLSNVVASVLRVGDNLSGALTVDAAIAPTGVTNLVLGSGSTVSQAAAGTISITNLGVKSLGTADLSTATNLVSGDIAAALGDGSNINKNFSFKNSGILTVGVVDGIAGISTQISGVYDYLAPNGVISLVSTSGAVQQNFGALLGGKAVYAEGTRVVMSQLNPTGVIAGKAIGTTGDFFEYFSSSPIKISTVNGFSGIQNSGDTGINLMGTAFSQDPVAVIQSTSALKLYNTSTGPVVLTEANNVASLLTNGANNGAFSFTNNASLTVGATTGTGINTSNQPVDITVTSGNLTVAQNIAAGTGAVTLTSSAGAINTTATTITGGSLTASADNISFGSMTFSGGIDLTADNLQVANAVSSSNMMIRPKTFTSITLGSSAANNLSLLQTDLDNLTTGYMYLYANNLTIDSGSTTTPVTLANLADYLYPAVGQIAINSPLTLSGAGSAMYLNAGRIDINAALTVGAGGVFLGKNGSNLNYLVGVGTKSYPANTLELSNIELNRIATTGPIVIGDPYNAHSGSGMLGTMQLVGPINLTGITTQLRLVADSITQAAGATITVPQLAADAYVSVTLPEANNVGTFAAKTDSGSISFANAGALTIGTVATTASPYNFTTDGVIAGGNIVLAAGGPTLGTGATTENLTIDRPVQSSTGSVTLSAGNLIFLNAAVTGAGGVTQLASLNTPAAAAPAPVPETTAATLMTESTVVQEVNIAVIPTEESDPASKPQTESDEEKAKKEAKAKKDADKQQDGKGEEGQQYCN